MQVTGLPPVQVPAWQVSFWVQALPSSQAVPLTRADQPDVEIEGLQIWQGLAGFNVPLEYPVPPMVQLPMQAPAPSQVPPEQTVPAGAFVAVQVLFAQA
jgi:hypothetical protein